MSKKNVLFFSRESYSKLKSQQYSISDIKALRKIFNKVLITNQVFSFNFFKADIYYCWWASGSIIPLVYAKLLGKKIFVVAGGNEATQYYDSVTCVPQGYASYNFVKKFLIRLVLKYATEVICVSQFQKKEADKIHKRDYTVIYNSVDNNVFKNIGTNRKFITMIANFDSISFVIKRVMNFIEACSKVKNKLPDKKFLIIGQSGNKTQLALKRIKELKLTRHVKIMNLVENKKIPEILNLTSTYVQISDVETFGVSCLEAHLCGCKLVLSRQGALPEIFSEDAIFCDHNDIVDISKKIIQSEASKTKVIEKSVLKYDILAKQVKLEKLFKAHHVI